jgi:hypothetical protein
MIVSSRAKSTTKKRRTRRRSRKKLRDLRFFVVDFHSFLNIAHYDMNDSCGKI